MKNKVILLAALLALGGIIWCITGMNQHPAPRPVVVANPVSTPPAPAAPAPAIADNPNSAAPAQPAQPAAKHHNKSSASGMPIAQTDGSLVINGYAVQDPMARVALSYVGSDPNAEAYWSQAINNPDLPSEERKGLIEDLNEDGLSDPKHPSAEDMPIIASRIQLLESMSSSPMDNVNAQAMNEAYNDLVNLYNGLPVK